MIPWIDALPPEPTAVLRHLYREMGRLGMEASDLSPMQRSVLQDVEHWLDRGLADALILTLTQIAPAATPDGARATPIQVRAVITRRGALTLRLQPLACVNASERERLFHRRPHLRLVGPESSSLDLPEARPRSAKTLNELVLLRSVRGLGEPRRASKIYPDPVSVLLVFLVRRCYEVFIEKLCRCAPVEVVDQFVFAFERTGTKPFQQLQSWKIVETQRRTASLVALGGSRGRARR
jgi:hypothetical protein